RTHRAHQHDGRGARVPALADVGTLGFLTDRGEAVFPDEGADALEALSGGRLRLEPRRLGQRGALGAGAALDAVTDGGKPLSREIFIAASSARDLRHHRDALQIR